MAGGSQLWAVVLPQVAKVVFPLTLMTSPGNPKGSKRGCPSHTAATGIVGNSCELKYTGFVGMDFGVR